MILATVLAALCLVVAPQALVRRRWWDHWPRSATTLWAGLNLLGWMSLLVLTVRVGLGAEHGALLPALAAFARGWSGGHPLRGLGLANVVGLSLALDLALLLGGGLILTIWRTRVLRRRQREVLDLVGRRLGSEGLCLLEHAVPTAYYLPGAGGRVVLSTGALRALDELETVSVLAHEDGHRRRGHGVALAPLAALAPFVPFLPLARHTPTAVRAYLEMGADDFARERVGSTALDSALVKAQRFALAPSGSLGLGELVERRRGRLGRAPSRWAEVLGVAGVASASLSALALVLTSR